MTEISVAAQDLFFKLRNRFPKINMGDEDGNNTVDPEQARFFNFIYTDKESKRPYGHVTCSVVDNNSLKVFFDTDITERMLPQDKPYWYQFLRELRRMAKGHMLNFDVRDITKDTLSRQDLQYMSKLNPEKKKISNESIMESRVLWNRRGKISEGDINNVRIHVVHNERMLENTNNRLLKVDRIYLINESGEKFLLPFKSVSGAKAMANHVSRGGNPYDTHGQVISRAVSEMRNLGRFAAATRTKTFESEHAGKVISAAQQMKESIRRSLMRLSNNTKSFTENLKQLAQMLPESPEDLTELRSVFTTQSYNQTLDNYLGSAAGAYQKLKENAMYNVSEAAQGVEQKIMDPNFLLVLKADPAMDNLMVNRRYTDNKALLSAVLGDIANRLINPHGDDVANFAALMGDLVSTEGEAFGQKQDKEYLRDKKLAIMLAQRYMKDMAEIKKDANYAEQVRQDPQARTKMADRKPRRTEADEFAEQIALLGEEHNCTMSEEGEWCPVHGMEECWQQGPVREETDVAEAWGTKTQVNPKEKGKYHGKTKQQLRSAYNKLKASGPHKKGSKEYGRMRELAFAIRAKSDWGKVGEATADAGDSNMSAMGSSSQVEENINRLVAEHMDRRIRQMQKIITENYIYAAEQGEDDVLDMSTDHGQAAPHTHDEYDGEASMAKTQLKTIERAASELEELLASNENLPEWIQAKITKAADYISMAKDTMMSRHEQGQIHTMDAEVDEELHGGQVKLDKNHNGKLDREDFAMLRGDKKTNEGNKFSGKLAKAKASHKDEFEVDGKEYKVRESGTRDSNVSDETGFTGGNAAYDGPPMFDRIRKVDDDEYDAEMGPDGGFRAAGPSIMGYKVKESDSPKADKDYDGDGEIESEKDEVWGSRMAAAKKAGKMDESLRDLLRLSGRLEYVTEDPVQMNPITNKPDSFSNDDSTDQFANAPDPTRDNIKNADMFNQMRPGDQAGARMVYDREHGLNPPGGAAVGADEVDAMYAKEYAAKMGAGMGHLIDPKNPYLVPGYTGVKDSFGKSPADWAKEAGERRDVIANQGMDAFNAKYGLLPGSPRFSQVTPQNQELENIIGQHNMLKAAGMPSPYDNPDNVKAALDAKKPSGKLYKDSWYQGESLDEEDDAKPMPGMSGSVQSQMPKPATPAPVTSSGSSQSTPAGMPKPMPSSSTAMSTSGSMEHDSKMEDSISTLKKLSGIKEGDWSTQKPLTPAEIAKQSGQYTGSSTDVRQVAPGAYTDTGGLSHQERVNRAADNSKIDFNDPNDNRPYTLDANGNTVPYRPVPKDSVMTYEPDSSPFASRVEKDAASAVMQQERGNPLTKREQDALDFIRNQNKKR
jgi:hypothetical protein